tara:strand:- start:80 stop:532 length:453 start_codon:yes stop_codon:yes gene_type:complete
MNDKRVGFICKSCDEHISAPEGSEADVAQMCDPCRLQNKEYYARLNAKEEKVKNTFAIVTASIFTFILIPLGMYLKIIPPQTGWIILYLSIIIYGSHMIFFSHRKYFWVDDRITDSIYSPFLIWVWFLLWLIAIGGSILGSIIWIVDNTG